MVSKERRQWYNTNLVFWKMLQWEQMWYKLEWFLLQFQIVNFMVFRGVWVLYKGNAGKQNAKFSSSKYAWSKIRPLQLSHYIRLYFSLSLLPRQKWDKRSNSHHQGEWSFIAFVVPKCVSSEESLFWDWATCNITFLGDSLNSDNAWTHYSTLCPECPPAPTWLPLFTAFVET